MHDILSLCSMLISGLLNVCEFFFSSGGMLGGYVSNHHPPSPPQKVKWFTPKNNSKKFTHLKVTVTPMKAVCFNTS